MHQSAQLAVHSAEKIIAILDLGSNSARLLLVRLYPDGSTAVLNQVKHMVRLGEGGFIHGRLQPESMMRTLAVLRGMANMCDVYHAEQRIAIATAAVRDALNGNEFIQMVREKTGFELTVISGREEARLIYLGVSAGLPRSEQARLFIDIGGGSTELVVGTSDQHLELDSLKLGCVRLTNLFFKDGSCPVPTYSYAALQRYIRNEAHHAFQRLAKYELSEAVASSGTAQNLAEMASAFAKNENSLSQTSAQILDYKDLRKVVEALCSRPIEERKLLPGINPNRADVLIPGAAILQTIMEEQGFESISISNRNLQNGILVDYLRQTYPENIASLRPSPRETSVLQMARFYRFEETHARHVAKLALELFTSAKQLGLHELSDVAGERLYFAGLLHDIGIAVSFSHHNEHSHYIIKNTELLGFTAKEITLMAALAFFHNKRPGKKHTAYLEVESAFREEIKLLSLFLILAEGMDRSHCQVVRSARFERMGEELALYMETTGDNCLEREKTEQNHKWIKKYFKKNCTVRVHPREVQNACDNTTCSPFLS